MLIGLLLCSLCALATSYVYDAGGRLVAVSNDTGASARYSYDNIGNLVAVDTIAGQLAIFAFSPGRGAPGTPVTIKGQGFSATASQNAVQFNGVAATVSTASSTELTVVVPSGATTGPIAITVGSATASSAMNFIVDPAATAPTIDTVAPTLLAIGESVTVTGKGFLPAQGQTSTLLNARAVLPTTLSNTTIVFPVPANVGSGKVTVTTPYGSATSAQDVVVVPAGIDKTQIESIKRLTFGAAPQPLSVTTAGNSLAVLYDLTAGDYPSLQFSGLGAVSVSYTIYGPTNTRLATGSSSVSASAPSAHLPRAPASGTYLVLLQPSQAPATWQLAVEKATPLSVNGAALTQPIIGTAQSKRFVFNAVKGQNLGLGLSDMVTPNTTSYISLQVFDPGGAYVTSQDCYVSFKGCQVNLSHLALGPYTVVVSPPSDGDKTMQFTSMLSADLSDSLTLNTAKSVSLTRRGQNARLSFSGKAGQQGLALQVSGQSTAPANATVYYTVYAPDGSQLNSIGVDGSGTLTLSRLPADGTYTVFVDPYYGETANATLLLSSPVTGTTPVDGTPGSYANTEPEQNVSLSFTATAGQNLGFALSDIVTPNATSYMYLRVRDANDTAVASQYCYASTNGCQVNLSNLAGGTYTVLVSPPSDGDQRMQFTATLSADVTDSLALNTAKAMSLTHRGQNARLSFSGKAGQQGLALSVSGQSTAPANATVYYTVYAPDGSQVNTVVVTGSGSGTLSLPSLPADGTYTVFVDPYNGETASATVLLSSPITGTTPVDGTPGSYATTVPGQNVFLSFSATAGQNLGFALSDIVTPNAASPIYLQVSDSAGTFVAG
ncbi:IPT/TIG domain-containing protein, partial [Xanthomonas albilineans]|uniref:IPT/TIG domain-containing protein n=1 Tax=Xanthomonas albilineans TaxID=29447 RepID=UPI000697426C